MKVTLESIKAKIKGETYLVLPDGRTTVCQLTMENGYTVNGHSACVDASEFNRDLGRKYAFESAVSMIWPLEGYLLAQQMHEGSFGTSSMVEHVDSPINWNKRLRDHLEETKMAARKKARK